MRRIISILMENEPGALSRVVGLFSQRGYNIETLNVAATEDSDPVAADADHLRRRPHIEQITKHLNRLVDVVKLVDLTEGAHVERDLMLIKVRADATQREEIKRTTDIFRGQIVDVGPRSTRSSSPAPRTSSTPSSPRFPRRISSRSCGPVWRGLRAGRRCSAPLVYVVGGSSILSITALQEHAQEHSQCSRASSGDAFFRGCSS
jgi:acetolactate synthase-1/3 small subunit